MSASSWWALAVAVVIVAGCVDQLARQRRAVAVLQEITVLIHRGLVGDPYTDDRHAQMVELQARSEVLWAADRRATWTWMAALVVVTAAAVVLS